MKRYKYEVPAFDLDVTGEAQKRLAEYEFDGDQFYQIEEANWLEDISEGVNSDCVWGSTYGPPEGWEEGKFQRFKTSTVSIPTGKGGYLMRDVEKTTYSKSWRVYKNGHFQGWRKRTTGTVQTKARWEAPKLKKVWGRRKINIKKVTEITITAYATGHWTNNQTCRLNAPVTIRYVHGVWGQMNTIKKKVEDGMFKSALHSGDEGLARLTYCDGGEVSL